MSSAISSGNTDADLNRRRVQIRRGLGRANTAVVVVLLLVIALSLGAALQGFRAERNAHDAELSRRATERELERTRQAEARALLEQARAQRRTGEVGQRLESLSAVARAAALQPSAILRDEAIAALALPDLRFVPLWTNPSANFRAQFSPNLRQIAISGAGGEVKLLNAQDGHEEGKLAPGGERVAQLWFSPDGRFLAAHYLNGSNLLWELATKAPLQQWGPGYSFVEFCPSGQRVLVAENSGELRCIGLVDGLEWWHCRAVSERFSAQPQGIYFAAAVGGGSTVQVRSLRTGELVRELVDTSPLGTLTWSLDGKKLVVGRENGWLDVWDADSWRQTAHWRAHDDVVVEVRFDPAGRWLVSSSWDGTIHFWSLPDYRLAMAATGYQGHYVARFSPDGGRFGCIRDGRILGVLEATSGAVLRGLFVPPSEALGAWCVDVSVDGKLVAAGYPDGVRVLELATGQQVAFQPVNDCRSALFTMDGAGLVTCGAAGLAYWPIERAAGAAGPIRLGARRSIRDKIPFVFASLSGDGRWAAAANREAGCVEVYELNDPTNRFTLRPHARVQYVALSPNGHWVASGTWDGHGVKIWEVASRRLVGELAVEGSATVEFSPNSQLLVTGSHDYRVWESGSWRELYRGPEAGANAPPSAFSPDGRLLAVLRTMHVVEFRESATGRVLAALEAPGSTSIARLRFTADAAMLLALEWTGQIRVWDLRRIHEELARLNLDWETNTGFTRSPELGDAPTAEQGKGWAKPGRSLATTTTQGLAAPPGSWFYILPLGGVALGILIAIYTLRYHQRMMRSYEEVETLVAQRNRQLDSARTELLHSQKMRALGTLAAGIAHDFNNLLSVIRMSNKLIDRQARARPDIQDHVADVEQAVLQGKGLVGSMLGYARSEEGVAGPSDLCAVVESAVSLLTREFLSGIALTLELDRRAPRVKVGRGRLEQVLLNLLVNASEAMHGQGKLKIVLRARPSLPLRPYVLQPPAAKEFVELNVIDSGPGIPPEIGDRLFEPFFTTKQGSSKPGTGLGLSLVYSVAQEHKLGLSVESVPGQGATFTVVMPAV